VSGPAVCERQGDATLGVRTARGDFERALVADLLRLVQAVGVDELQADGFHRLMAVEDVRRFLDGA
jgi:hypothetical protein